MARTSADPIEIVETLAHVRQWAEDSGLSLHPTKSAFGTVEEALIAELDDEAVSQFERGAGGELRKMRSLRSSSALGVNVFFPWNPEPSPIAHLLGGSGAYGKLRFEEQYPTGVSPRHPHLDVIIEGEGTPVALESKYLEIYDEPKQQEISDAYFKTPQLWTGLSRLRMVAESIASGDSDYQRFAAAQLVKHALGLANRYGPGNYRLVYIWFEVPGQAANQHRVETERFARGILGDIDFLAITYQDLYSELRSIPEPTPGYLEYLRARYLLDT